MAVARWAAWVFWVSVAFPIRVAQCHCRECHQSSSSIHPMGSVGQVLSSQPPVYPDSNASRTKIVPHERHLQMYCSKSGLEKKKKAEAVSKIPVSLNSMGKLYFSASHHSTVLWLVQILQMHIKRKVLAQKWGSSINQLLTFHIALGFPGLLGNQWPCFLKSYEGNIQL